MAIGFNEVTMLDAPCSFTALLAAFAQPFTAPSFHNFRTLAVGAVLAPRSRTITGILRAAGDFANKHYTSYHRFLSHAAWDAWSLSRILAGLVLSLVSGVVTLVVDDTTTRRWGPRVYGKSCHRDAVRSSQTYTVHCYGHKWVVLSVLVQLPFCSRPWALPVMSNLYLSRSVCSDQKRYRTLIDLACIGLYKLRRWFPTRRFIVVGDGGYASVAFANSCKRLEMNLISRLRKDTVLYEPPPPRKIGQRGRPPKKGKRMPSFAELRESPDAQWNETEVAWYGGTRHTVRWLTGTGFRYAPGESAVQVRWVLVDGEGKAGWECFFSTDLEFDGQKLIESYVQRWSLEVTFEEVRAHLGLETCRNWAEKSIRRSLPCLFGLFSLITIWYSRVCLEGLSEVRQDPWYRKTEPTFSDALVALRKHLWARLIFDGCTSKTGSYEIPPHIHHLICDRLAWSA